MRTINVNTDKHLPNINPYFIIYSQGILWWPGFSSGPRLRNTEWATVPCTVLWKDWGQPKCVEINADYSMCLTVWEHTKTTKPKQLCADDRGLEAAVGQPAQSPPAENSCPIPLQFLCSYDLFPGGIRPAQGHWIWLNLGASQKHWCR